MKDKIIAFVGGTEYIKGDIFVAFVGGAEYDYERRYMYNVL